VARQTVSAAGMFSPQSKHICTQMQATSLPFPCIVAQQYTLDEPHFAQVTPRDCLFATIRPAIAAEVARNPPNSCDLIPVAIAAMISDSVVCISNLLNLICSKTYYES